MTDAQVKESLKKYSIGLTVDEARKIETMLGRAPTVVEAVIWGIQGSEHSSYKSSRRFLKMFPTTGKHVILGPKEDSGIVAMTDGPPGKRWGIVISHESHNHPSQIVPFEGAATGVGGTVRDVACMGARVVGCMDLLRLGDLKTPESRGIAKEVMRGIGGYGNPLGVPNLGGDTVFDAGFNSNCLVNAIAIGIVREDEVIHSEVPEEAAAEGYDMILIGKPTDRSGFGGAAFASVSMEEEKKEQNSGAVQEPNPFLERHILVSTYALFDWLVETGNLHRVSFKDLGAGGVVCATVEQVAGKNFGADVELSKVHVSIDKLPPEVIACAETQERFCWTCHPSLTEHILKHYNETWDLPSVAEKARASVIGKVNGSGIYHLTHNGMTVCKAKSQDITSGLLYTRPTKLSETKRSEPDISCDESGRIQINQLTNQQTFQTTITSVFKAMLSHPNHASKSRVFRHFDKSVIGNTVLDAGEADASVIMPLQDLASYVPGGVHPGWELAKSEECVGAVFAGDGNPRYGRISAYGQGALAALESMMNVAAVGGTPRALTDCLNYGNPEIPEHLASLEEGVRGISDAARTVTFDGEGVPVISGNVSLYNSLSNGSAIPASAIVCCIGVMPDARKAVTQQLKKPGSRLFLIGERKNECGGSAYYEVLESMMKAERDGLLGCALPRPDFEESAKQMRLIIRAIDAGLVLSSHDISDGGLLLALFEMLCPQRKIDRHLGVSLDLSTLQSPLSADRLLFSQTPGFLVEVDSSGAAEFTSLAQKHGAVVMDIGESNSRGRMSVRNGDAVLMDEDVKILLRMWETSLAEVLDAR
ncbi:MAG: phosphoribosylformylglycinamidine synthase subunit PurL [Candidatus Peribacteraceae bacterium]|nr:phosphoribosylformylglycinamidine synthase subunit PurL [Candidatus Peribacteraceae bacterium]